MERTFLIFGFTILLIILQLIGLFLKWRYNKSVFYLISISSIFWGGVFYFYYGFPLDEGTCPEADIPVFELGFQLSAALLITCITSLGVNFFLKKRT